MYKLILSETLAKLYWEHGYLEKAYHVFDKLLQDNPDREDWISSRDKIHNELSVLNEKKKQEDEEQEATYKKDELVDLFKEWFNLLIDKQKIMLLKQYG